MDNHRHGKWMEKAPKKTTAPRVGVLKRLIKAENPNNVQRFEKT